MIDFERELNPQQYAAVKHCDGPSLVIAGAGSGKTRVLTYKIAYLLEHHYEQRHILALTFTNKAANEMKERIMQLVGHDKACYLWMGTFHSIFARILRFEAKHIGYLSNYTIYDQQDSLHLVKLIIKERGLEKHYPNPSSLQCAISEAKNMQKQLSGEERKLYDEYQRRLREANAMDFDDLLVNTYRLFRDCPDVLARYQERFRYVLVDEYQDTNKVQHLIIKQLTRTHRQVCVVGDDAQSIYSFRGAMIDNILSFETLYEGTRLFKLEQNYRSTQTIVSAANSLIRHNRRQIPKNVYSERGEGELIDVIRAYSDREEASVVCRQIARLRTRPGFDWCDVVILYRTNAQSRVFEEELRHQGYPYHIVGGLSFYQRKEIKDAVAYLRLCVNPTDEVALLRAINTPARGIGDTTMRRAMQASAERQTSLWRVISDPAAFELQVNKPTQERLKAFAAMIAEHNEMAQRDDAYHVARSIIEASGLRASVFASNDIEDLSRQQNLQELMNGLQDFVSDAHEAGTPYTLTTYLESIQLLTDADRDDDAQSRLTMMTVHAAKGLEFPYVFVVGMEEGLFPSEGLTREADTEEERRLFYVAMTRAKERLWLTWSQSRMVYGRLQECREPSQFIAEIDKRFLRQDQRRTTAPLLQMPRREAPPVQPREPLRRTLIRVPRVETKPVAEAYGLRAGTAIEHPRFGLGRVLRLEGDGLDAKATVSFENVGEKTLLLRFAKFRVVE